MNHRLKPKIRRETMPGSRLTKVIDMPISRNDVYINLSDCRSGCFRSAGLCSTRLLQNISRGANSEFRSLKGQRTVPGALSFAGLLWCRSRAYCARPSSLTPPWKTAFLPPESTNTRSRSSHFGARKLSHASNCRNTRFKAKTLVFQGIKPDENGNNQAIPSVINEAYFVRPEIREVNPINIWIGIVEATTSGFVAC